MPLTPGHEGASGTWEFLECVTTAVSCSLKRLRAYALRHPNRCALLSLLPIRNSPSYRHLHLPMADYNAPPPPYPGRPGKAVPPDYDEEASRPLLSPQSAGRSGAGGIYDQPNLGEIPDDFLVSLAAQSFFLVCLNRAGSMGPLLQSALCEFATSLFARFIPSYVSSGLTFWSFIPPC